jgi:hypothetical protein
MVPNEKHADANHWNQYISNVQQSRKPAPNVSSPQPQNWDNTQSEIVRKYLEYFC